MAAQDQTYFAQGWTDSNQKIGIAQADRRFHFLATGRTGTGKSSLLLNMLVQDIKAGRGVGLIDPHGDLAETVLPFIPRVRRKHLVYISPTDLDYPVALNPLGQVEENERHLVAENLLTTFQKIWQDSWGPRMAYLLSC